ncbi:type VI secretion system protein TssA [Azotobacter chroococcum]|uniref:Type VI secretion system protein ImpA n=1 Tax=Azotobacter chroococcum TaxID=353 RepID=A0A4V2Q7U6_9GAMM|nr:type VI secretion system protein TssA [Azotobacter chroococcum]TBV93502.1 type VI secretion system protein TssA [Azotobacter chroococcum]TCL33376.1 type VI secretion system protein ImpA [Azotobacter chroococcum]
MSSALPSLPLAPDGLLEPLSADSPCGPSLRYDPDFDRLREARREDDASLPSGVWQAQIKRSDWAAVEKLAGELLLARSKDLMVAAWLGEAWLHRRSWEGLPQALALVTGLCERYPDELHPRAEEGDRSWRVMPLDWLIRRYAELLLLRLPLFEPEVDEFGPFALHDWRQLQLQQVAGGDGKAAKSAAETARQKQRKLNERVRSTPLPVWLQRRDCLERSTQSLERLERWSDDYLGDLAPGFGPLREVIRQLIALMQEFIAMHPHASEAVAAVPSQAAEAAAQAGAAAPSGLPGSREQAYRQLELIADYLARTEPHSPVPYLIRRAVEWGHKPLGDLLSELLSADPEARRVWTLLGILK